MPTTQTRKSVPLTDGDLSRIERYNKDLCLRAVMARHAGVDAPSESVLLHTLLAAGLDALDREADEERYAQLAASQDDEDRQYHAAMRLRRR